MTRAQADSAHQAYLKNKEMLGPLYEKITELSMQLRNINDALRDEYKARKAEYENRKAADAEYAKQSQQAIKEKEQAMLELKNEIGDLVIKTASKVIRQELTSNDQQKKIIEDSLKDLSN